MKLIVSIRLEDDRGNPINLGDDIYRSQIIERVIDGSTSDVVHALDGILQVTL
jgi:hypothetical protein